MCDPYNSNPFKTDNARDSRSEYDANRNLRDTINREAKHAQSVYHNADNAFDRAYALGMSTALTHVSIDMLCNSIDMTENLHDLLEA